MLLDTNFQNVTKCHVRLHIHCRYVPTNKYIHIICWGTVWGIAFSLASLACILFIVAMVTNWRVYRVLGSSQSGKRVAVVNIFVISRAAYLLWHICPSVYYLSSCSVVWTSTPFWNWLTTLPCFAFANVYSFPTVHLWTQHRHILIIPRQSGSRLHIRRLPAWENRPHCMSHSALYQSFVGSFWVGKLMNMYPAHSLRSSFWGSCNKARWESPLWLSSGFKRDISPEPAATLYLQQTLSPGQTRGPHLSAAIVKASTQTPQPNNIS